MSDEKKPEQVEWFDDRFYRMTDDEGVEHFYPSVTTILNIVNKPFLSRWRGDVGNWEADRRMNYAAWRGSRIHDGIHRLLSIREDGSRKLSLTDNPDGPFNQDEWLNVLRFVEWFKVFNPEVLYSEYIVASRNFCYAGTADLIVRLKAGEYQTGPRTKVTIPSDGIYLGDIKTGKVVDDDHHFQTAAYSLALGEEDEELAPVGTFILHLGAENAQGWKVHLRTREEVAEDFNCFTAAQIVWRRKNPNMTPKVFTMPTTITLE